MGWYKYPLNKTNKELTLDLISNCPELVDALKTNNLEEALDIVMHENHRRDLFYDNREAKSIFIHFLYENGISIFAHIGNDSITFSKFSINHIVVKTRIFEIFILKINM